MLNSNLLLLLPRDYGKARVFRWQSEIPQKLEKALQLGVLSCFAHPL